MKFGTVFSILMATAFVVSCSSEQQENNDTTSGQMPILLGTKDGVTRSTAQDTQLTANQLVRVWAKHTGTDTDYLRAWELKADGSGGLTPTSTTRYYPADGTNIDLYALHGNFSSPASFTESTTPNATSAADATDGTTLPATATHSVLASQVTADNYSTSDLMAVKVTNVGPKGNANQGNSYAVNLPFRHQLARLEVAIVNFNDLLPEDIESITLMGVKTTTSINPPTSTNENGAVGSIGTTLDSPTSDIVMHPIDDAAPARITAAECIIPAQELTATPLVRIKLKSNVASTPNNDELYYKPVYKSEENPDGAKFEIYNGVTYRLELTISKVEITGFRVGWTAWSWKDLSDLNEADDGLLYYFPMYMDTSESSLVDPTDVNNSQLQWEYGGTGTDSGLENTKGSQWL
ncbi:MAG: fimbrillin family protein [Prevotella sp.]|nr:fimbrillin family protein [Prevotella sp.]